MKWFARGKVVFSLLVLMSAFGFMVTVYLPRTRGHKSPVGGCRRTYRIPNAECFSERKSQLTLLLTKKFQFQSVALLIVIGSGFNSNPSHSTPCTIALDICVLCVVTTHTEPEIRYIILASVCTVSRCYTVALCLIHDRSVCVSHVVIKLHVCHLP